MSSPVSVPASPPFGLSTSLRPDSWKDFTFLWSDATVRQQYGHKILGLPLHDSYELMKPAKFEIFARSRKCSVGELLADVKSWHHDLLVANGVADKSYTPIQRELERINSTADPANLAPSNAVGKHKNRADDNCEKLEN